MILTAIVSPWVLPDADCVQPLPFSQGARAVPCGGSHAEEDVNLENVLVHFSWLLVFRKIMGGTRAPRYCGALELCSGLSPGAFQHLAERVLWHV